MRRPFTHLQVVLLAVGMLLLSACATDPAAEVDEGGGTTTETVTETVTAPADDGGGDGAGDDQADAGDGTGDADGEGAAQEQPFPANTERDVASPSGEQLMLTDVRVGLQDGYDRVTFEFSGNGEPGWVAEYTDSPQRQGSGDPIEVAGDAVLQIQINSVGYPVAENSYDPPDRQSTPRLQVVEELVMGSTFEGTLGAFIGVGEQVPFRVQRLADPPRVVVDVVHPDAAG